MNREIYLDYGSGTPPHPAAADALSAALEAFGDPLSLHAAGRRARGILDASRTSVAESLGAQADEIVLTSGGTESVALAFRGVARASGKLGDRVLISEVEHPCVHGAASWLEADGFRVAKVAVDGYGRLDLDAFMAEVRRPDTLLASVQHSNHEVGTLQPVAEAARLCREAGVWFHTDACQSVGRLPVDVAALGVDLLTLSGHKFGGFAGAGALFVRRGVPMAGYPCGDDRERHRRAGTENIAGVTAMAAALTAYLSEAADQAARQWAMTGRIRSGIEEDVPSASLHGHPTQRAPHLACFSVPGVDPEILLMALDDRGYRVGIGSFSTGLTHDPSPVLEAMGIANAHPVRIGVGRDTRDEDIDGLLSILPGLITELQRMETASSETLARLNNAQPGV